jgi:hypothetical protein
MDLGLSPRRLGFGAMSVWGWPKVGAAAQAAPRAATGFDELRCGGGVLIEIRSFVRDQRP